MKETLFNDYKALFEKHQSVLQNYDLLRRGFVFQFDEGEQDCDLLYVGINPSYNDTVEETYNPIFTRDAPHAYFKPFQDIHVELKKELPDSSYSNWTHIDWFVFRETDQKQVEKLMKDGKGVILLWDQLEIAKKRLYHIAPKVIIVSNALAREFTGKNRGGTEGNEWGVWMGFHFEFDEEYGSWRIKNDPKLAHTHVLFSSMLSGQRALDLGSRERLVWQVRRILMGK